MKKKVLIIGGGPAGCSAAHLIHDLDKYDVDLVESTNVLGAGVRTQYFGGHPYTFGPRHFLTQNQKVFDYINNIEAVNKVIEEANELKKELKIKRNNKKRIQEELGDLIFSCLDVSRKLNLNPDMILSKANNKFIKRWKNIEKNIKKEKKIFKDLNLDEFNKYWQKAKK